MQTVIELIQLICGPDTKFVLFDDKRQCCWASPGITQPIELSDEFVYPVRGESLAVELLNGGQATIYTVASNQLTSIAYILLLARENSQDPGFFDLQRQFILIESCLAQVISTKSRISADARELLSYLELSQTQIVPSGDMHSTVEQLEMVLQDCVSSMELDVALLFHTDGNHEVSSKGARQVLSNAGLLEKRQDKFVRQDLFRLAGGLSEATVLDPSNTGVDGGLQRLMEKLRIILIPIKPQRKHRGGVLALFKDTSGESYVNSDKRLATYFGDSIEQRLASRLDQLSGFLRHHIFLQSLQEFLKGDEKELSTCSFIVVELDYLEDIYINGGAEAGMHVLSQVSAIIGKRVRSRDFAGRLCKSQFALVLRNCKVDNAISVANQIIASLSDFTFMWSGELLKINASVGIVSDLSGFESTEGVFLAARSTLHQARQGGEFQASVYDPKNSLNIQTPDEMGWAFRVSNVINQKAFRLYCQPIEEGAAYPDEIQRYELLLRLNTHDGVLIAPYVFISAANRLGMMHHVDRWVVKRSFELVRELNENNSNKRVGFSVNLSANAIGVDFLDYILNQAKSYEIDPETICFEITELTALNDFKNTLYFISGLRKYGFQVTLDDFGVGVGAYSTLKQLSVDYVKINSQLIKNMMNDPVNTAIVTGINRVCRALSIKTIAESVENQTTRDKLVRIGIDYIQGYETGRPRSVESEFSVFSDDEIASGGK